MMRRRLSLAGARTPHRWVLVCMTAVTGTVASLPDEVSAQAAGQWRDTQQMFELTCAYCHTTGIGPELRGRGLSSDLIVTLVRHGTRAMPTFRPTEFSDQELAALSQWLSLSPAPIKAGDRP